MAESKFLSGGLVWNLRKEYHGYASIVLVIAIWNAQVNQTLAKIMRITMFIQKCLIDMTHYYLYIESGVQLDADTIFYKVGIGESEKQRKIYAWLESYAIEHGHYFVSWTRDAAEFYLKCSESIGPDARPLVGILGAALMMAFKNGCHVPATFQQNWQRHNLLMRIDPSYYATQMIITEKRTMVPKSCSK